MQSHDSSLDSEQAPRPFADLLVVELGQIYNGPYCGSCSPTSVRTSSRSSHPVANFSATEKTQRWNRVSS